MKILLHRICHLLYKVQGFFQLFGAFFYLLFQL